jgi:UDP-GlcNAc:undecaprenyl-phosphate GlcNAc-1-phosphate transferase
MMKADTIAATGGFVLVVLLVPIVTRLCVRWGLYDWPGPLKVHTQPIPRLGGIAVTFAIVGGVLLSSEFSGNGVLLLFAALLLICVVGAIDDICGLSAVVRLAAQLVAGAILWFGGGRLLILGTGVASLVASSVFAVVVINALNFLDGADGVASGVAGIIAVTYGVLPWPTGDRLTPAVAWTLAGACVGFLLFNFPRAKSAKIFLRDSGSTVFGLCVGFLSVSFCRSPFTTGPRMLFPLVVAGLPLIDTALAVIRRIRGRVSPLFGDRRHFYDLWRARGASERTVALVCYGVTALFCLIGSIGERAKAAEFFILASVSVGALLVTAIRLGALQPDIERAQQVPKALTEISQ